MKELPFSLHRYEALDRLSVLADIVDQLQGHPGLSSQASYKLSVAVEYLYNAYQAQGESFNWSNVGE